jgi:hypothetical protein
VSETERVSENVQQCSQKERVRNTRLLAAAAHRQAENKQSKQANKQASKQTSKQTNKANKQASKRTVSEGITLVSCSGSEASTLQDRSKCTTAGLAGRETTTACNISPVMEHPVHDTRATPAPRKNAARPATECGVQGTRSSVSNRSDGASAAREAHPAAPARTSQLRTPKATPAGRRANSLTASASNACGVASPPSPHSSRICVCGVTCKTQGQGHGSRNSSEGCAHTCKARDGCVRAKCRDQIHARRGDCSTYLGLLAKGTTHADTVYYVGEGLTLTVPDGYAWCPPPPPPPPHTHAHTHTQSRTLAHHHHHHHHHQHHQHHHH